ncbi:MAG TPA: hypothetical protein VFE53_15290 [Mucilaginibacter sp.]|nr:hypothetical protein [Mucilaginibacter sp.]
MQDKELDEVFRSKLDGFETEPSANVWPGISDELDSKNRRKTLVPWLSIAASIVVLAGVGLFFIPKKANTGTKPEGKNPITVITHPAIKTPPVATQYQVPGGANTPVKLKHEPEIARLENKHAINTGTVKAVDTVKEPAKTIINDDHQMIANIQAKSTPPIKPVVPDVAVKLAANPTIDQSTGLAVKPDKLAAQNLADNKKDSVLVKRRHKIRNFGDLVNLVVDKLDKRQDKVIQFADDEDGDSHLTGVNLGIVKIKKGE